MKNFNLNSLGVHEMNALEMQETDGGIIGLLIVAAAVLLCTGCIQNNTFNFQSGTNLSNKQTNTAVTDTSFNGNKIEIPLNVPIGY